MCRDVTVKNVQSKMFVTRYTEFFVLSLYTPIYYINKDIVKGEKTHELPNLNLNIDAQS
jgi:hypothetical protein